MVGLLQRVSDVEDDGHAKLLHGGDVAIIHHQILIAEHRAAFGEHDLVVARLLNLLDSKSHSLA